ncbi:ethanolamine ammonia-lyase reactivating factor EutA [Peribacillus asahii]|uniref:Ethanolamine utilization protein n=1 Tax=Peribacillus asahii TaxID=228899 RepID=A0A3T0KU33_9BACI|nr:ethanolamine ammonia-lyase reactivating factor EutA [Peribacillus asahii]AZV43783.1 ethanolamine utilization protein [Peribacillus asahii]USK83525.1 ethanolamine ammonia-lyase reactivating factor EutA [Peribacillus asahii]
MNRYDPQKEDIFSAGIDIGTSTTKLVISKFSLMNLAGGTHMPRIEIVDKEVIHRSPIYRTPLLSPTTIDIAAVETLVKKEYEKAGIQLQDIKTGAVIITGETATKKNAEEMIHHLSSHAGEFLVATAGPDLESIIAAKGSGAYQYSKKTGKTIANIDIGGGTANVAVYKSGRLCGTCTLHIGGRLVEFAGDRIHSISPSVKKVLQQWGAATTEGDRPAEKDMKAITDYMAEVVSRMLKRALLKEDHALLLGHEPDWTEDIDAIMFSGGISECIYQYENRSPEAVQYDDIGMMLAASIKKNTNLAMWRWIEPEETVRATVLGAGTQTTEISGATIQVDSKELPVRNLPVYQVHFEYEFQTGIDKLANAVTEAIEMYDPQHEGQNFALYLTEFPHLGFRDIQQLAASLLQAMTQKTRHDKPLVIVLESDHAKVLGQTLYAQDPTQNVICIDQIKVEHGDYLDIGTLLETSVVPVVIKTLTFHK